MEIIRNLQLLIIDEVSMVRCDLLDVVDRILRIFRGTFTQFPIRLAWAITVHKSQGLTFEHVIADLGAAFTHGQVYVALSRCTSLEGLILKTKINRTAIKTDPFAIQYAQNEMHEEQIAQTLNIAKNEESKTAKIRLFSVICL